MKFDNERIKLEQKQVTFEREKCKMYKYLHEASNNSSQENWILINRDLLLKNQRKLCSQCESPSSIHKSYKVNNVFHIFLLLYYN